MKTFAKLRQLISGNSPYIVRNIKPDEFSGKRRQHQTGDKPRKDVAHCNMCGKALTEYDAQENFGFDYHIGYGSRHDMEIVKARFCCDCFDDLLDSLIHKCKINPVVGEYDLSSRESLPAKEPDETQ